MKHVNTEGIVLTRTDYRESDRILTILTNDCGKIQVIARGVRKIKSKLSGGIELFSINQLSFIPGKSSLSILSSARMKTHYNNINKDLNRTMLAYDFIRKINKITENAAEEEYFNILRLCFESLENYSVQGNVIQLWFTSHLLKITGHEPNLRTDTKGDELIAADEYLFDYDLMAFSPSKNGIFSMDNIKLLRLVIRAKSPEPLRLIQTSQDNWDKVYKLMETLQNESLAI